MDGLNAVKTAIGFGYLVAQLVRGAITISEFITTIYLALMNLGTDPETTIILFLIIEIVTLIFDLIIDAQNAPVTVGDFTFAGGKSYLNPGDLRPDGSGTYGQFVGYGKVQNIAASNDYANWLNQQAVNLYNSNPAVYPNPSALFALDPSDVDQVACGGNAGDVAYYDAGKDTLFRC